MAALYAANFSGQAVALACWPSGGGNIMHERITPGGQALVFEGQPQDLLAGVVAQQIAHGAELRTEPMGNEALSGLVFRFDRPIYGPDA